MSDAPNPTGSGRPQLLTQQLLSLRSRMSRHLITQRALWLLVAICSTVTFLSLLDYLIRFPTWLRWLWLVAGAVAIIWATRRYLLPAWRFQPNLEDIALRLQDHPAVQQAGLSKTLAPAVGLESVASQSAGPLAREVSASTARTFASLSASSLLSPKGLTRAALGLIAILALGSLLFIAKPSLAMIGLARTLTPWSSAQWPKRTDLRDLTTLTVHPNTAALSIKAALLRGKIESGAKLSYRVDNGPLRSLAMVPQGRMVPVPPRDTLDVDRPDSGALFEAIVEPGSFREQASTSVPIGQSLTYWLTTQDDQTEPVTIRLVPAPAITSITAAIAPPAYANHPPFAGQAALDLADATDGKGILPPILQGSTVTLAVNFSKPVKGVGSSSIDQQAFIARALGEEAKLALHGSQMIEPVQLALAPTTWQISWTHRAPVRLTPSAEDLDGIPTVQESMVRAPLLVDRPPAARLSEPASDDVVLPQSKITLAGEGRDDIGLKYVAIEGKLGQAGSSASAQQASSPAPGGDANPAPVASEAKSTLTLLKLEQPALQPGTLVQPARLELDLAPLKLTPGQTLAVSVIAADAYELSVIRDGQQVIDTHPPARSAVRILRVVSPDQFAEQIYTQLAANRALTERASNLQQELTEANRQQRPAADVARRQSDVSTTVQRLGQTLEQLSRRVDQSGLENPELKSLLTEATQAAEQALTESRKASDALQQASRLTDPKQAQQAQAKRSEAAASQELTEQKLAELSDLLDRGQDAAAIARNLEGLAREQEALQQATSELAQQTAGKSSDQLTPEQKQKQQQLAEQQSQLQQKAEEALAKIREEARQREQQGDPEGLAEALKQAADRAQRSGLLQQMRQASQRISENRQQQAQQNQQQAAATVRNMLQDVRNARQQRDATLRRQLASLIETIEALIARQTRELANLQTAAAIENPQPQVFELLAGPMGQLHASTLAAIGQSREMGNAGRQAGLSLSQAADQQQQAAAGLREAVVESAKIVAMEESSLSLLRQAREQAQQQQDQAQQRDEQRRRAELRGKYEDALRQQAALSQEITAAIPGGDLEALDRRQRLAVRQIAQRQDELGEVVATIRRDNSEIRSAELFELAHERYGRASEQIGKVLRQEASGLNLPLATSQRVLQQIITALSDEQAGEDDPFREPEQNQQQQGGGGGQQQQGLIPPAAELKLIKVMQEEALELTRQAEQLPAAAREATLKEAAELQNRLASKAENLLKKLMEQSQAPPAEAQPQPGEKPDSPVPAPPVPAPPAPDQPKSEPE